MRVTQSSMFTALITAVAVGFAAPPSAGGQQPGARTPSKLKTYVINGTFQLGDTIDLGNGTQMKVEAVPKESGASENLFGFLIRFGGPDDGESLIFSQSSPEKSNITLWVGEKQLNPDYEFLKLPPLSGCTKPHLTSYMRFQNKEGGMTQFGDICTPLALTFNVPTDTLTAKKVLELKEVEVGKLKISMKINM